MSLTQSMLQSADVSRLGWTLVHSLWQGAAIAALLAIVLFALRRKSSQSRYAASCVAIALLLVLPIATFVVLKPAAESKPAPPQALAVPASLPNVPALINADVATPRAHVTIPLNDLPPDAPIAIAGHPAVTPASEGPRAPIHAEQIFPWLVFVWALGVAAMSLWNLGGWIALQRLKSVGAKPASQQLQVQLAALSDKLGLRRSVKILESLRVRSPMVIGAFKPIVLIPASVISELPAPQLESILAHELAHIRRHDYLVNLIQSVIETLLFYHPATWWISRVIRTERENCCDDVVLEIYPDRAAYVSALASIAAARMPSLAVAARGGLLLGRVRRILGIPDAASRRTGGWAVGIIGLVTCMLMMGILTPPGRNSALQAATTQPATQPAGTMDLLVVDAETKLPISDALVNWLRGIKMQKRLTDASGHVRVDYSDSERLGTHFAVYAKHAGYVETGVYIRTPNQLDPIPSAYTLVIHRGTHVSGKVVNEQNKPVAGATVHLEIRRSSSNDYPDVGVPYGVARPEVTLAVTDADGRWSYDMAPADPIFVTARLSHPDYLGYDRFFNGQPVPTADLRSGSSVIVLKKGALITGRVEDKNGKPIGSAHVVLGRFYPSYPGLDATSNADGTFTLPRCQDHVGAIIVATAAGREPQDLRFDLNGDKAGVIIRMPPSKPFNATIVDRDGNPIAGVSFYLSGWHGLQNPFALDLKSDNDGHITWTDAPSDKIAFSLSKIGYIRSDVQRSSADGEQKIVLQPELHITGTVVDDVDGKPIPHFHLVKGWFRSGRPDLFWEPARFGRQLQYENGRFDFAETEPRDGFGYRVEADNYMPQASRVLHADDGNVNLEFRLKEAPTLRGQLVSFDGQPLTGADVIVCTGSNQVRIANGKPSFSTMAVQTKSGSDGRFTLSAQPGEYELLVVHEAGFADLKPDQIKDRIVVQPWCHIEGIARVGGKPAQDLRIAARYAPFPKGQPYYWLDDDSAIDANGHFELKHVPPAQVYLHLQTAIARDNYTYYQDYGPVRSVDVKAGAPTHFDIDGTGRPVIGHLVIPPEILEQADLLNLRGMITSKIIRPTRTLPENWKTLDAAEKKKVNEEWGHSPEGIAYRESLRTQQANIKRFQVKISAGGSFRADDVPEGTYLLSISLGRRGVGQMAGSPDFATAVQEFTIAPMPGGRTDLALDLGSISLTERKQLETGDIAPPLKVDTLDGKSMTLKDLRGKVVLVDFWATWCKPCVDEMPTLKGAFDEFKSNPHFQMVSMSLDETPQPLRDFVASQKLEWIQGFIGSWEKSNVPNQWGVQGIPAVFLIAPDGTIAATRLHGDQIKEEIRKALSAIPR